ncbi:MAG TPA: tetratricopeptide repeat protein [Burkholderiaceae bacterium]|nr:tetratricopeptide repeat protein [Burkholderiaceae bacterium]
MSSAFFIRACATAALAAWLAGCASAPPMPPATNLFHDDLFAAPSEPVDPGAALAVSAEMQRYVHDRLASLSRFDDRKRQLFDALYKQGELQLEYDAAITRTAAQAFDARSGNCLALVMMTAAFAKEMGLAVRYQIVVGDDAWDRAGDLYVSVGHVNLTLFDKVAPFGGSGFIETDAMTVDFVPPRDGRKQRVRVVPERTIVAMYLNNRAVEALAAGQRSDAYWWAREAVRTDPDLLSAYITLGVVYRNTGHADFADAALRRVNEREPDNTKALSNRILVLRDLGRQDEASALARRLEQLDPHPPYSYFLQGMAALRERRVDEARRLFEKEVERAPYQHEFQFWLAVTHLQLNQPAQAAEHLERAIRSATTRRDHDLYAAKLDRLKALTSTH